MAKKKAAPKKKVTPKKKPIRGGGLPRRKTKK